MSAVEQIDPAKPNTAHRAAGVRVRLVDLGDLTPSPEFIRTVPITFARRFRLIGYDLTAVGVDPPLDCVLIAAGGTPDLRAVDNVSRLLGRPAVVAAADTEQIQAAINAAYESGGGRATELLRRMKDDAEDGPAMPTREDLLSSGGSGAPVVQLVNSLLFEAVVGGASDVHVQPREEDLVVRNRLDGVLHDVYTVPKQLRDEVVTRLKVLGGMNIAEKRLPQDGRASVDVGDRRVDLRIASMPTSHGERVVVRLLDKSAQIDRLDELGLSPDIAEGWRSLIKAQHGLILVTGPTGSGKSTTLYSSLKEINSADLNVLTLEDPIEYQLDGISQTQVNVKKGMTFATGLRSILRQDPDIVMVGEIRDRETAEMAIQSALTGHLVFSTLHTNDAPSAVTRLLDLGIEPYLVASSLLGVMAQRLVRRNCDACATADEPSVFRLRPLGVESLPDGATPRRSDGCESCRGTGFRGRFVVAELVRTDDRLRDLIQARANAADLMRAATENGTRRMVRDGVRHVAAGLTTPEEVLRVTARAAE